MEMVVIGNATLYFGDCMEVVPSLEGVDALIGDPPYGINLNKLTGKSRNRWNQARRTVQYDFNIIGDDRPFDPGPFLDFPVSVLWGANHYASRVPDASCWLIWDKRDGSTSDHQADCEMAWSNLKGPARLYSHKWRGQIRAGEENISRGGIREHPTQKPVALMAWVISQCRLSPGSLVVDPFMGSGTTGVAAVRMGHRFVGCEVVRQYFDVACRRIEEAQAQGRLFDWEAA